MLCSGRADLEAERRQASFDARAMNYYIHGGKEIVEVHDPTALGMTGGVHLNRTGQMREMMLQQFERDLSFRVDDHYDLTKDEQRRRVMTRVRRRPWRRQ